MTRLVGVIRTAPGPPIAPGQLDPAQLRALDLGLGRPGPWPGLGPSGPTRSRRPSLAGLVTVAIRMLALRCNWTAVNCSMSCAGPPRGCCWSYLTATGPRNRSM